MNPKDKQNVFGQYIKEVLSKNPVDDIDEVYKQTINKIGEKQNDNTRHSR